MKKAPVRARNKDWFDPLLYVTANTARKDDHRAWFIVDPAVMYPAVLKSQGLTGDQLKLASTPRGEFDATQESDRQRLLFREQLLEAARKWFTALLHATIEKRPMGLTITRNEDWKL
jgi:hypothetical protein